MCAPLASSQPTNLCTLSPPPGCDDAASPHRPMASLSRGTTARTTGPHEGRPPNDSGGFAGLGICVPFPSFSLLNPSLIFGWPCHQPWGLRWPRGASGSPIRNRGRVPWGFRNGYTSSLSPVFPLMVGVVYRAHIAVLSTAPTLVEKRCAVTFLQYLLLKPFDFASALEPRLGFTATVVAVLTFVSCDPGGPKPLCCPVVKLGLNHLSHDPNIILSIPGCIGYSAP